MQSVPRLNYPTLTISRSQGKGMLMRDASQVLTVEVSEVDKIMTPFESAPSTVNIPNARYRPLPPANNGKRTFKVFG